MTRRYRPFDPFERGGPFEGAREIRLPRPPRRFWVGAALFGLAVLIFIFASPIVWLITELQWYDALGLRAIFTTRLSLQAWLFFGSFLIAFAYLAVNLVIALRLRSGPTLRAVGIRRSSLRSAAGVIGLLGAGLIALVLSGGAGSQWQTLALFQHSTPTGVTDPVLGQDVSFYLLTLPFLHAVANWALGLDFAAVGVWVAMLVIGQIYPGIVQSFFVTPSAQSYELPYIEREIAGTRAAYGLSTVKVSNFSGDQPLTLKDVQNDQVTVDNLRLWDYTQLQAVYEQLQTIRTYYSFNDIDIDRYTIAGQYRQIEISARELDTSRLPQAAQNWVNQHLQYTHGYGLSGSPVNAIAAEGLPDYVVRDIPPTGPLAITDPAIYFGELTANPVLAPSNTKELDYPQGSQDVFTSYKGKHGVLMGGANRALWSLKLGDFNLLVSPQITDQTQMLYRRNILERVNELAPFLTFDRDPYVVVVDGKVYWILDGYTSGSTYPYSQSATFQGVNDINYIRNSVKVVIDAYEGTADFYILDPKDPLIKAYVATFPSLFKPIDAMPAGLRAHLRVPVDLFNVQIGIYATYHITDPKVFFAREDVWDIPTAQTSPGSASLPVQPYYVLFRLPGEQNPEFLLIMPFTPRNKNNMVSWMAARSDGAHYGEYVSYVLPKDKVILGPQQVANLINQEPAISRDFTLFHGTGSQVQQGNLPVVPFGNSFLYFEPIYLKATSASGLPELKKVILADQSKVVYTDTLQQAIDQLVGTATAPPPTTNPPPTTLTPAQVAQIADLVTQANQHYAAAYAALKAGDLTTFANEMAIVGKLLQQLQQLTGTTATSPSPSPRPTPSP